MKKTEKKISFKEMIRLNCRALKILYHYYPQVVLSQLTLEIYETLTPYIEVYCSALIINELAGNHDIGHLKALILLTLSLTALFALVHAFLKRWNASQSEGLWLKFENIYSEKSLDLDYMKIDDPKTSELLYKVRQNENGGGWGLYFSFVQCCSLISSLMMILGGIALTISLFSSKVPESAGSLVILNHPLTVLLVIGMMLGITLVAPMIRSKANRYYAQNANMHNLSNRLFSFFGFLGYSRALAPDIRMYRQDKICNFYNNNKEDTFCSKGFFAQKAKGPMGLYAALSDAVAVLFIGVAYGFVCLKALAGAFSLGSVTQYIASITKVSKGISDLISTLDALKNNVPFLEIVYKYLDIPNDMYQGSLTVEKRRDRKYQVEFCDVSFKYPGSDNYALRHVNMKFEIGKRLAVVGMNGSGKTTFIKLLCRLYDPTEGEILLNGIDIRKYNYREYMNIFSIVFQDFELLGLKLGENVASRVNYDKELVLDCLKKAGFMDKLEMLPDGLDTYLYKDYNENGIDVSGGEAQKIAIARALYKDAPFIVLDEPTAALDPIAEAEIYSKFDEIAGDKTAIYISHRLSSCKFCDKIAVFDEGKVIQQGTHAALVADQSGKYYELWHAQAQYYTEDKENSIE